jgi:hypothetical protein
VVRTFVAVFPYAVMLRPAGILIGSEQPIPEARRRLLEALTDPAIRERLHRGNPAAATSAAEQVADAPLVWTAATPRGPAPLTDMRPRDEFFVNNRVDDTWGSAPPPDLQPGEAMASR